MTEEDETKWVYGEADEEVIRQWKEQIVEGHKEMGHNWVIFDHRMDMTANDFQFRIKAGGYETEDDYPDFLDDEEGVQMKFIGDDDDE